MNRIGRRSRFPAVYLAAVTALTYLPILLVMIYSVNRSKITSVWDGFSLRWYRELFRDSDTLGLVRSIRHVVACVKKDGCTPRRPHHRVVDGTLMMAAGTDTRLIIDVWTQSEQLDEITACSVSLKTVDRQIIRTVGYLVIVMLLGGVPHEGW